VIRRIRGQLVEVGPEHILLQADHLCYEVFVAPATSERLAERPVGAEIELHTFYYLQDDQARSIPILMGFESEAYRDFFECLIQAPRFGPRGALRSMTVPLTTYARAIEIGDSRTLKSLPGIGASTAKSLIAQLQGKLGRFVGAEPLEAVASSGSIASDVEAAAVEILQQLGVPEQEAMQAVLALHASEAELTDAEQIVKAVLRR
jgi:holliday junction DNA helicase RuvA